MSFRNIFTIRFIAVLSGVFIISFTTLVLLFAYLPYQSKDREPKSLIIENGEGLSTIASKLKEHDLIRSKFFFKWLSIALGNIRSYKKGEYLFEGEYSAVELAKVLKEGRTVMVSVTFPEGFRISEMISVLNQKGFTNTTLGEGKKKNILWLDKKIKSKNIDTLEGFLFPDTYKFSKDTSQSAIINKMVKTFFEKIPSEYELLAQKAGLSYYEAVILASIIEKETGVAAERKLISSVFHNRLRLNMKLQTDPTVIYGIKNFDGNLTRRQLRTKTPYNTYTNYGLPPTPIANPGLESLLAAVSPANSDYIYFVAKGDGTHEFSKNYRDHSRAVAKYQRRRNHNYRSF